MIIYHQFVSLLAHYLRHGLLSPGMLELDHGLVEGALLVLFGALALLFLRGRMTQQPAASAADKKNVISKNFQQFMSEHAAGEPGTTSAERRHDDYYGMLGTSEDATDAELKKAYRKRAHQISPDRMTACEQEEFRRLQHAYEVLSHPDKRRQHDDMCAAQRAMPEPEPEPESEPSSLEATCTPSPPPVPKPIHSPVSPSASCETSALIKSLKHKGNSQFRVGDFTASLSSYTQAISLVEEEEEEEEEEGSLYLRPKGSQTHVLYSNRCAALLALGDFERALEDADTALKLCPGFIQGYLRRGTALQCMGGGVYLREAEAAFKTGLDKAACADLTLSDKVQVDMLHEGLSAVTVLISEHELNESNELKEEEESFRFSLATSADEGGQEEEGEDESRSSVLSENGEAINDDAFREVPSSVEDDETDSKGKKTCDTASTLKSRGNEFHRTGSFSKALEQYTAAIDILSSFLSDAQGEEASEFVIALLAVCHCNAAASLTKLSQYAEAIDHANKALEIDPGNNKAESRKEVAAAALQKAQTLSQPTSPPITSAAPFVRTSTSSKAAAGHNKSCKPMRSASDWDAWDAEDEVEKVTHKEYDEQGLSVVERRKAEVLKVMQDRSLSEKEKMSRCMKFLGHSKSDVETLVEKEQTGNNSAAVKRKTKVLNFLKDPRRSPAERAHFAKRMADDPEKGMAEIEARI